jgi:beta-phosphoglucomutase-like phosphatase (HAD superfamily)
VRRLSRDVPLAIASGAQRREIELVIDAAGLRECFECIVAGGDTPQGKPAPDPYVRALGLLRRAGRLPADNGAAGRSVAIEDSPLGIASARAAGLRCVAVTTSYPADRLGAADLVVGDLDALDVGVLAALIARA